MALQRSEIAGQSNLQEAVGFKKRICLNEHWLLGPHCLCETKKKAYDHLGQPHIYRGGCAGKLASYAPVKNDIEQVPWLQFAIARVTGNQLGSAPFNAAGANHE
jgi:hypothetical protein